MRNLEEVKNDLETLEKALGPEHLAVGELLSTMSMLYHNERVRSCHKQW
jgi:hypothetical protein